MVNRSGKMEQMEEMKPQSGCLGFQSEVARMGLYE